MNTEERIIKILQEMGIIDANQLETSGGHAQMIEQAMNEIDSMTMIAFIVGVENEFDIEIPDEMLVADIFLWSAFVHDIDELINMHSLAQ